MPALGQIVCPNRRISAEKPCKERNPINRYAAFAAVGAVLALEILWGLCWIRWGFFREKTKGINHDIVYYISAIILAAVTMPIFCTVFSRRWKNRTCTEDGAREIVLEGVTALALAAALISVFYYEPFVADAGSFYLPWHITKKIENLFLLVAVICIIQVRIFIRRPRTACQVKLRGIWILRDTCRTISKNMGGGWKLSEFYGSYVCYNDHQPYLLFLCNGGYGEVNRAETDWLSGGYPGF